MKIRAVFNPYISSSARKRERLLSLFTRSTSLIEKFEDILAWQKSKILTLLVYKTFSNQKDYGFKDQIQRASVSTMNNIAEGFERRGDKEFKYFLSIAKGSCGEVRSMLYLGYELKYISKKEFDELYALAVEVSKIIAGLTKVLNF